MEENTKQVKKRRITPKDWDNVADFVTKTLKSRETGMFRKKHERVWAEVDRQVSMEPMKSVRNDVKDKGDWHNVIELGELARASEIITADAMRLLFPNNRAWFEAHSDVEQEQHRPVDKALRALMTQQHTDFGFKERLNLSIHEALHHGGFVVEVEEETALKIYGGTGVQALKAPVWKPHSMWNCYPDPSPSTLGTNTFYNGSMIIKDYMPLYLLKEQRSEGWMPSQIPKVRKRKNVNKDVETQDIELVKYFGDIVIPRQDGDILLPNSEVILAHGTIVYYSPSKLPFPRVIYNGYERMDVRDPYYTSPLIKTAPTAKMASRLANKALDSVDLWVEPPIVYDGNDPNFVQNGGPTIAPGAKSATKGMANFKEIKVGDPQVALNGLTFILDQVRQSTSVDAQRSGGGDTVERSATASRNKAQRGEVRVVDFVDKLDFSLKTFLYMQHEFNKDGMQRYSFYNPEMDAPDFVWATKQDLPKNVHFEVVGSKGILGEEERSQKTLSVTMMAAGSDLFRDLLDPEAILKQAYMDAGNKNPEQFLKNNEGSELDAVIEQLQQEAQEIISQYEKEIFELQKDLAIQQAVNGARVAEAQIKAETQASISEQKAELQAKLDILDSQLKVIEAQAKNSADSDDTKTTIREIIGAVSEIQNAMEQQSQAVSKVAQEMESSVEKRFEESDKSIKSLLERVNRPMSEKIKEAKAALAGSNNE